MSMLTIVCVLAGCSQKSSTSDNERYKSKTVFGVVSKVGSDSLTINVGAGIGMPGSEGDIVSVTLDENGKTVSESVMGGSDGQDFQGEPPEMPEGQENGSV